MKELSFASFLCILAMTQATDKVQIRRKLQAVDFVGDGCIDYNPTDMTWIDYPFGDDETLQNVPLGFSFTLGGTLRPTVDINSNGHLHFDGSEDTFVTPDYFVNSPYYEIAPYWADVNVQAHGDIRYKQFGDKFVVFWVDAAEFGGGSYATNTFQVVLSSDASTDPKICFCYHDMQWVGDGNVGISMGPRSGFHLAEFTQTDATWNGLGTTNNGVQALNGRSFCFNPNDVINPRNPPTEADLTFVRSESNPGTGGDPHFKTWHNEHYQYHGQCDLVLAKDATFADELGLDIHIRTKLVRHWSYIKTAAIRIGNDILEIEGSGKGEDKEVHYWMNYEYQGDLTEFAGFPVTIKADGTKLHKNRIEIDLSSKYPGQKIVLSTFKEFVKVDFVSPTAETFGNTVGMLGDYKTGKTLARDGSTVLDDFTDLGREWQVLPFDKKLFRESSAPQFRDLCIEPEDPRGDRARRRRLDESSSIITEEQAEAACAGLKDELDRKDCIYDIVATQDMDMAGAY